jgi:UPF0716 family protein affecting phage T7 exclusion
MIAISLCALVCIIGLIIYLATIGKPSMIGLIMFAVGLGTFLLRFGGDAVKLLTRS